MDVLGIEGVREDTISSSWLWHRSLSPSSWPRCQQILQNVLFSAQGQHYFLIG